MMRYLLFYFILYDCVIFYSSSEEYESSEELKNKVSSHIIPYSEHENPPEPATKLKNFNPNYKSKPLFINNASLEFTPNRLYVQVRHRDIVKRLPREHVLNESKSNEERDNINRLRAVVKKQKINTYYTEEGYEDAAYDHAGHIRDADFDEKYYTDVVKNKDSPVNEYNNNNNNNSNNDYYEIDDEYKENNENNNDKNFNESVELKKSDIVFPHYGFFKTWEESGNNPRKLTKTKIRELERDLLEKNRETADSTEINIPENSKYLADNSEDNISDSDEYNTILSTFNNDHSNENDISNSVEFEKKSESTFRIVAAPINSTLKFFETNVENNMENSTLKLKPLSTTTEKIMSESTTATGYFPSLSQIYETWKRKGVEEKYEESSEVREGEQNLISNKYSSEEKLDNTSTELKTTKRLNKKYVLLVRKPTVSCNDSKLKDLFLKSKEPTRNNEELTVLRPPAQPLSKQVMYTDFLPKTHDNLIKPSVTQKIGSIVTSNEENNTPSSILIYRYYRQPHYRHQPTWKDLKNYILPSVEMFPPIRTSRSEYAHYNTERRNRNNKPQYNFRPEVMKKRLVFRIGSKTEIRPKYSMDGKKRYYEKVPLKGVKNSYQSESERKLVGFRQKRDTTDLLNDAPKIVEQVIKKEIDARFPEDQNRNNNDEKHRHASFKKIEKEEDDDEAENVSENKKKVEVEVPEFNFFDVNQLIKKNNNSNKEKMKKVKTTLDNTKYPFYYNNEILRSSPLKYIMNPQQIPHKTLGGSEFYDSRDKYLKCEEIDPNLSTIIPEKEEPMPNQSSKIDLPRLRGLGDKISCYKAKYFDKNPLDNPLFYEKTIESPNIPEELNPFNFITHISHLSGDLEENVYRRVSKKPEIIDIRPLESRKNEIIDPDQYKWSQPEQLTTWSNHAKKHRNRSRSTTVFPFVPYQKLVYENVMDTIKNLTYLYKQHPLKIKSRIKVPSRLKKVQKSSNVSRNQNKKKIKNHYIYITTQTPDVSNVMSSFNEDHHRKIKIVPYKTNKVTYRTRKITRPIRGVSNKTIGYLKTVRVHKREADLSDLDFEQSKITNVRNNTLRKRYKKPENNTKLDQNSISAKKIAYTIIDRAKNFNTQKTNKYVDFTTESTSLAHIASKNKPNCTTIRRFDEDIYKIKTTNNPKDIKKINERYDVYEENQDEQTENPNGMKQKEKNRNNSKNSSDDIESNNNSDQFSGSGLYDDEFNNDDSKADSYEKKNQNEDQVKQVERPYASGADSNIDDESNEDESDNSENYHEDENGFFTISNHEKDFERYSSRPLSPYQSFNDPKYAELGPRINKPAFYHPSFESLDSVNHDLSMNSEEHENKYRMSKFMFPWHDNDKNISEKSKKYKKISKAYEFPWERRARLQAMKKEIDRQLDEEQYPLESVIKFEKKHPLEQSIKFRFHKFGRNFWKDDDDFDSHGISSEIHPTQYNHHQKIHVKPSREVEEELIKLNENEQENSTDTVATMTTTILQIPATSEKFLTMEKGFTTPTNLFTTLKEVYTVRPRSRRREDIRNRKALIKDQMKSESEIVISSTPKTLIKKSSKTRQLPKKNYNNNNNNYYHRRRFRIISSSTTIKPLYERLSSHSIDSTSTTPTTNKIEHRSKLSKEEIITKTTFPLIKRNKKRIQVNHDNDNNKNDYETLKNKVVRKLSIESNENLENIFIKPNNRTQVLSKIKELLDDSIVDKMDMKNLYNQKNNHQEAKEIDENLPLNDKLQLTEHDTKKKMASFSWP